MERNQLGSICHHLGYTENVRKQTTGSYIKRMKINKLLLVQDLNLSGKYQGQDLNKTHLRHLLQTLWECC